MMSRVIEGLWFVFITAVILGSCIVLEKENARVYEECLKRANNVRECDGVR